MFGGLPYTGTKGIASLKLRQFSMVTGAHPGGDISHASRTSEAVTCGDQHGQPGGGRPTNTEQGDQHKDLGPML